MALAAGVMLGVVTVALPFLIALVIPIIVGEPLCGRSGVRAR